MAEPPRLTAAMRVAALLRRVNAAGGFATVLARGEESAGAILIQLLERDGAVRLIERGIGASGAPALIEPRAGATAEALDEYVARRRRSDPDLWVVELAIADGERFAAETIMDH